MAVIGKPFFVVPLDLAGVVCDSANTGHPVSNLGRFREIGLTWKSEVGGAHWVRGQFDGSQPVDFCAIIAANAGPATQFRLRLGTSQAEVDGGSAPYDSGTLNFISTTPAAAPFDGLFHSHLELPAAQTASWWRIDITGQDTPFEAAALVLGKRIEPSRFYNLDYEQGVQDLGSISTTRWGVFEDEPGLVWRTLDFTLAWQNEVEFETMFRPLMQRLGVRQPVFVCFDSTGSAYRQARTYMGLMRKALFARGVKKPRTFAQEFSLLSFI